MSASTPTNLSPVYIRGIQPLPILQLANDLSDPAGGTVDFYVGEGDPNTLTFDASFNVAGRAVYIDRTAADVFWRWAGASWVQPGGGGGMADGVISSLAFDSGTRTLTVTRTVGGNLTVVIPDRVVTAVAFDSETRVLTLTRNEGLPDLTVTIPAGAGGVQEVFEEFLGDAEGPYTLAQVPGTLLVPKVVVRGRWFTPGVDYTIVGADLTFTVGVGFAPPTEGDSVVVFYSTT